MGWAAQYDATYASAKLGDVEGDEQAEMESGGFEIGEHLGHVDGSEGLYELPLAGAPSRKSAPNSSE
jgi:hypothetical protein